MSLNIIPGHVRQQLYLILGLGPFDWSYDSPWPDGNSFNWDQTDNANVFDEKGNYCALFLLVFVVCECNCLITILIKKRSSKRFSTTTGYFQSF